MKSELIIGIFALILLGTTYAADGQSAEMATHVIINEADTNPPGDDSKSISEWVEIYNPTTEEIYIGGWKIASTTVLKKTLTLPVGATIKPGQFLTYSYQSSWFTDVGERIELRDETGKVIDETPNISDVNNDFNSWQRIYDGFDTNSSGDWKYKTSTAGSTNGKLSLESTKDQVSVTISTDKINYLFDETATISGSVSKQVFVEKPSFGQATIDVSISGPNYFKTVTLYPDLNLGFKTTIKLQKVLGINEGIYDVVVNYAGTISKTQFSVGNEKIELTQKDVGSLTISTDKESYLPGQTATIFAKTTKIIEFEGLKFEVISPNKIKVFEGTLYPNVGNVNTSLRGADSNAFRDAQFITNIFMTTVSPSYGTYTINAQYGEQKSTSTFELTKDVKEEKIISLATDKQVYGLGETVVISGRLNNLFVPSLDLEVLQTRTLALDFDPSKVTKELGAVRLAGDSTFKYVFQIPNNSNSLGGYKVTVSKDVGQATTTFLVVNNPDEYEVSNVGPFTVSTSKTIYEIGDELIISGRAADVQSSSSFQAPVVKIQILKADGSQITIGTFKPSGFKSDTATLSLTAVPDIVGSYKVKQAILKNIFAEGTYNIKASYADGKFSDSTTFSVVDPQNIGKRFLLQLNKQVFGLNEEVILEGLVPGLSQGSGIEITLIKPDGDTDKSGKLADNSRFTWSWTTPRAEKTPLVGSNDRALSSSNYGIYQLIVGTNSGSNNIFFKVSPNPDEDTLELKPLQVSTDKVVYSAGETLKVSGIAVKRDQGKEGLVVEERAQIVVKTTTFPIKEIYSSNVYLDVGGNFKTSFTLPVTIFKEGNYKVEALYQKERAETIFTVDNDFNIGGDAALAILLSTDKDEYGVGETVKISGKPSKIVYLENLSIKIVHEEQLQITCGSFICGTTGSSASIRPSASGSFTYEYLIPSQESAIGVYEITVDAGFGKFSKLFSVTEKATLDAELKKQLETAKRSIEKVNRISDSFVPITIAEKISDGQEMLPRVLQGSLLTSAVGEEHNVNIKVTAEDGTCVIGQESGCLVTDSTRGPGTIYQIVEIDGKNYNVRYSGPDARLEKFTILPESSNDTLPSSSWNVEVIKDEQPSRLYYKITYITPV